MRELRRGPRWDLAPMLGSWGSHTVRIRALLTAAQGRRGHTALYHSLPAMRVSLTTRSLPHSPAEILLGG
jgi:hypothetical protein